MHEKVELLGITKQIMNGPSGDLEEWQTLMVNVTLCFTSGDNDLLGLPFPKVTLEPRHYLYNISCEDELSHVSCEDELSHVSCEDELCHVSCEDELSHVTDELKISRHIHLRFTQTKNEYYHTWINLHVRLIDDFECLGIDCISCSQHFRMLKLTYFVICLRSFYFWRMGPISQSLNILVSGNLASKFLLLSHI